MSWPKRVSQHLRTFLGPNRILSTSSRYSQRSTLGSEVDFLRIEAKGQARWDTRGTKIQEKRDIDEDYCLVPFYMDHIRKSTIIGTLRSMQEKVGARNGKTSMVEHILFKYDILPHRSQQSTLHSYSRTYGKDVVRTYFIFGRDPDADPDSPIDKQAILNAQKWFEWIWAGVRVAHESWFTPPATPKKPADPEKFEDYLMEYVRSLDIIPPDLGTFNAKTDEDDCALWLAAQEAILSMNRKSEKIDLQEVQSRLSSLASSIIRYGERDSQSLEGSAVHCHSTRILLSLLALFAPSFVEASWLALHYGHD